MRKKFIATAVIIFYLIYTNVLAALPIGFKWIDFEIATDLQKVLYFLITDLILIVILYFIYRKDFRKDFVDFRKNYKSYLDDCFKYWLIGLIAMVIVNFIIQTFITGEIAQNEEAVRSLLRQVPLYMLFASSLYAPFVEETIFRKGFRDIFGRTKYFVILSGLSFGALHVIGSMESMIDLVHIFSYSTLGIAFAYIYYKTDNIFAPITIHVFHNTFFILIEMALFLTS